MRNLATAVACFMACVGADAAEYPSPADVRTIDGIIRAYYEVISGPAGAKPDLKRDESLHYPGAQVIVLKHEPAGGKVSAQKMTLQQFHELSAPIFERGVYETEINRVQEDFGALIHVWSTYETRAEPKGRVLKRGINSIQLYFDGDRYWITSWIYDAEQPGRPIPPKYLPKDAQHPSG